jgi:tRNA pseudouridine13 synthase
MVEELAPRPPEQAEPPRELAAKAAKPSATLRSLPEDFVVDEIPAFAASGEGDHLYLQIRKINLTTIDATKRICRALDVDEQAAGYAGMKDKRAVTTQTISLPFARTRSPDEALKLELEGITISSAIRHGHKLKPGHLRGNRFAVVLRDIDVDAASGVIAALEEVGRRGVPNAFGPQRFGRDGNNSERALAWLSGRTSGPKDRREKRLLFSALQSEFFNRVLARREIEGTWDRPLQGDLLKKCDTGGLFLCDDPQVDGERASRKEVSPTGPIFGVKMRWPEGRPAEIEREILVNGSGQENPFDEHRALGEGSRRPLVLFVGELTVRKMKEDGSVLLVEFVLPKGGYATTVLSSAVALQEKTVMR